MKKSRLLCTLLSIAMIASIFAGCSGDSSESKSDTGSGSESSAGASGDEVVNLELTVFRQSGDPYVEPKEDLVGQAIEKNSKYRVKLKEVFFEKSGNWTEEYNLFAAANNFPDVCVYPSSGVDTVSKYKKFFHDLSPYVTDEAKTPNMHKYHTQELMDVVTTYSDIEGNIIGFPIDLSTPDFSRTDMQEKYNDYFQNIRSGGSKFYFREDILKKLGYSFTPVNDLIATVDKEQRYLQMDELKLDPPVETVAQFEELLRKIKDAGLENHEGAPVVPLSGDSLTFNLGGTYAFDFFRKLPDGTITSYWDSPYAKEYCKTVNTWYRDGLYDSDVFLMKNDQKAQKISNGEVAGFLDVGSFDQIQENLLKNNPEAFLRPIPMVRLNDELPQYIENVAAGSGQSVVVNKNYKKLDELMGYLDWLYSDEAQDMALWGDGEGVIWEEKDGKKTFIDPLLYESALDPWAKLETADGKSAQYYGLAGTSPYTLIFNGNKWMNPYYYKYSVETPLIGKYEVKRAAGEAVRDVTSKHSVSSPRGETAARANNYFWAQGWDAMAKIVLSEDDAAFESNYTEVYNAFMKEVGDMEQLRKDMADSFRE